MLDFPLQQTVKSQTVKSSHGKSSQVKTSHVSDSIIDDYSVYESNCQLYGYSILFVYCYALCIVLTNPER